MKPLIPRGAHVAVIGAGAGGLSAARILRDVGHFSVTIYEATGLVGGTWNYSDTPSPYSAMYQSLHCNLPHHIMSYHNDPFPQSTRSFPSHQTVAKYLHEHAKKFNLEHLIHFNTPVTNVSPVDNNPLSFTTRWNVETERDSKVYSAVVVANGHYSQPLIPFLSGEQRSSIKRVHSRDYRVPDPYRGKNVVVLGAGPSGIDISLDVVSVAANVYLSYRGYDGSQSGSAGVKHVACIKRLDGENRVELSDGSYIEDVDTILLCTGYAYSFPFLDEKIGIHVRNDRVVEPLWNHILFTKAPTLSFVGLVTKVVPWRLFDAQSRLIALYLSGDFTMSRNDLLHKYIEEEKRFEQSGIPERFRHMLGARQWDYRRELISMTHGKNYPELSEREMYDDTAKARRADPARYRKREYEVWGPGEGQWSVSIRNSSRTGQKAQESQVR